MIVVRRIAGCTHGFRSHAQQVGDSDEKCGATGNHAKVPHGVAERESVPAIEQEFRLYS